MNLTMTNARGMAEASDRITPLFPLSRMFSASVARNRQAFNDAIVFMIGGGNYIEYQNLQDYAKVEIDRSCTDPFDRSFPRHDPPCPRNVLSTGARNLSMPRNSSDR